MEGIDDDPMEGIETAAGHDSAKWCTEEVVDCGEYGDEDQRPADQLVTTEIDNKLIGLFVQTLIFLNST